MSGRKNSSEFPSDNFAFDLQLRIMTLQQNSLRFAAFADTMMKKLEANQQLQSQVEAGDIEAVGKFLTNLAQQERIFTALCRVVDELEAAGVVDK